MKLFNRKRRYYVSYSHTQGFGSCQIVSDGDFVFDQVVKRIYEMNEEAGVTGIVINFFKELKKHEYYLTNQEKFQ